MTWGIACLATGFMATRILRKRFGFDAELIDPRSWSLKGVPVRAEHFVPSMAEYYDLVVGLHPDEALRSVVESARTSAVLVIPCCNFWTRIPNSAATSS